MNSTPTLLFEVEWRHLYVGEVRVQSYRDNGSGSFGIDWTWTCETIITVYII